MDPDEVHAWVGSLGASAEAYRRPGAPLSEDERIRARRLVRERDRARFIEARTILRRVLGAYLGTAPGGLRFAYGPMGQPRLKDADLDLRFNLSHSRNLLLLAVARGRAVGVDVEPVRALAHRAAIERRLFSTEERRMLSRLPAEHRIEAFFNGWTRKEAFVKATGEGMWAAMRRLEVSLAPGAAARLLTLDGSRQAAADWTLYHLAPVPGFVGAVAVEGRGVQVTLRELEPVIAEGRR